MDKIRFETNIPVEVALRFLEGKEVESKFGGPQFMFSTVDNRVMFFDAAVTNIIHDQIRKLNVQAGEPLDICRREVDLGKGRKGIRWQVEKVGYAPGEQPDGTFAVPAPPPRGVPAAPAGSGASAPTPAPVAIVGAGQQTTVIGDGSTKPNGVPGNGNGHAGGPGSQESGVRSQERAKTKLEDALKTVIHAVHEARKYAKEIGFEMPVFTAEDLRTMANTLMIQNGGAR